MTMPKRLLALAASPPDKEKGEGGTTCASQRERKKSAACVTQTYSPEKRTKRQSVL